MGAEPPTEPGSTAEDEAAAPGPILGFFRHVNAVAHWIAGATMIALVGWTVIDIIGRRFFNAPLSGTVELTELAMIVIIYLGFALAENKGDHVAVDVVYTRLSRVPQLIVTVIVSVFGIAIVALLTYQIYVYSGVLSGGGRTTPTRGIPLGPVAWVAVGGAALFTIAMLDSAVTALRRFREHT